jgi:crossover junction endodeoxyribonuclease RuvC
MRILGIDPGLKATGYGFVEYDNNRVKLLETGTIEPRQKDILPARVLKVHSILTQLVEQYAPDVLVLEKLYAHSSYPTTVGILGHARGIVCLVCAQKNLKFAEYSVKRIRKAVTGNGAATKIQTQRMISHILKINEQNLSLDASDALALALGHVCISSRTVLL